MEKSVLTIYGTLVIISLVEFVLSYGSAYKRDKRFSDSIDNNLPLSVFMEHPNASMVVSSMFVRLPMCMMALIAEGKAKSELLSALGLAEAKQALTCFNGDTRTILTKAEGASLTIINKMYINDLKNLRRGLFANTSVRFGVATEPIAFKRHQQARSRINDWIDNKSFRRLRDTLDSKDVQANTSILLVNAAHFKVTWVDPFNILITKTEDFRKINDVMVQVDMMSKTYYVPFFSDNANEFSDFGMSFTLVVPHKGRGLPTLLKKMAADPTIIQEARLKSKYKLVRVQLPRFKIKAKVVLDKHLKLMGVRRIFNTSLSKNGLRNMLLETSSSDYIAFSKAKQQIHIEVDEYGIYRPEEPDFLTDYDLVDENTPWATEEQLTVVKADRPFMFSVNFDDQTVFADGPSHNIERELFTGVYYGPN